MLYDLSSPFDAIGEALAESEMFRDASFEPRGGPARPVRVSFEAPHIKVDAMGLQVNAVQVFAGGLARVFADAKTGDVLVIGGKRWSLKGPPESYGGAGLVRMSLAGPVP